MNTPSFGDHLRSWRQRRHLSQQALAERADLSTRHLSFLETGRASPSREMVLRLAERLAVPLRERNPMLQAAGYAPMYRSRPLDAPEMQSVRRSLDQLLRSHLPYPALVFDRRYDVVASNEAVGVLLAGVAPRWLQPPLNVVRLSLHPQGVAARIVNFGQWREHILGRLQRQFELTGDGFLQGLLAEVAAYPLPEGGQESVAAGHPDVVLPLRLRTGGGVLSFFSTVTVFGTPHDITLQELAVESFFPADDFTARALVQDADVRR